MLDYLKNNYNSVLFNEQNEHAIINAVNYFEQKEKEFSSVQMRESIKKFSNSNFRNSIKNLVAKEMNNNEF